MKMFLFILTVLLTACAAIPTRTDDVDANVQWLDQQSKERVMHCLQGAMATAQHIQAARDNGETIEAYTASVQERAVKNGFSPEVVKEFIDLVWYEKKTEKEAYAISIRFVRECVQSINTMLERQANEPPPADAPNTRAPTDKGPNYKPGKNDAGKEHDGHAA